MKAAGKWGWWNQHTGHSVEFTIDRAKDDPTLQGIITKASYPSVTQKFLDAGLRVGVEAYVYPNNPVVEGHNLAAAVAGGAEFAVINAEVEWEETISTPMEELIASFRETQPDTELYASTDTRANRTHLPYQQVLSDYITAWMPMIYPLAFYPTRPQGFVELAFRDCLDGNQHFEGKPVLPTIQTYDQIGAYQVETELDEIRKRSLLGYQAYTIGHATQSEWEVVRKGHFWGMPPEEEEDDMAWKPGDPVFVRKPGAQYIYAEVDGHHWHVSGDEQERMMERSIAAWPKVIQVREPEGTRLDWIL